MEQISQAQLVALLRCELFCASKGSIKHFVSGYSCLAADAVYIHIGRSLLCCRPFQPSWIGATTSARRASGKRLRT